MSVLTWPPPSWNQNYIIWKTFIHYAEAKRHTIFQLVSETNVTNSHVTFSPFLFLSVLFLVFSLLLTIFFLPPSFDLFFSTSLLPPSLPSSLFPFFLSFPHSFFSFSFQRSEFPISHYSLFPYLMLRKHSFLNDDNQVLLELFQGLGFFFPSPINLAWSS